MPVQPKIGVYPFWFWNGEQEERELARQLKRMSDGNCTGVALHSRTGNRVPYLSPRWLELLRFSCGEAKKLGLKIWLYDEDGYPSGNAGMKVQAGRRDLEQQYLSFSYAAADPDRPAFAAFDAETFAPVDEKAVPAGTPLLIFQHEYLDRHVDVFHPESARRFIQFTHEKYECLHEYFGNVIEAVYTDDESYLMCFPKGIAFSPVLADAYEKRYGESVRSILPRLVEDLPLSGETRRRYYALARELFLENFIRPQVDWCEARGLAYLGHLCGDEGDLPKTVRRYGSEMPYFRMESVPSIDDFLCDRTDQRYLSRAFAGKGEKALDADCRTHPLWTYKAGASAAHQFAHGRFSAETLTFLTWPVMPAFLDRQMFFEILQGVNLFTHHAYYYTIGGGTRNDCPPSYFFQSPFYGDFAERNRVWSRFAELVGRGKYHADTLLVYPEAFFEHEGGREIDPDFTPRMPACGKALAQYETAFGECVLALERAHVGFDFGDESRFAADARIENGQLRIGDMTYSTVIVPIGLALLPGTRTLLREFAEAGGKVTDRVETAAPDTENALDPEILLVRRDTDAGSEFALMNLSGRELALEWRDETPFSVYEPASNTVIFRGNVLPDDFRFPAGSVLYLAKSPVENAGEVPFETTAFAPEKESCEAVFVRAENDRPNSLLLRGGTSWNVTLGSGAGITEIYVEDPKKLAVRVNGKALDAARRKADPHPCDPCFCSFDGAGLFHPGENTVECACDPGVLFLEGAFVLDGETRLAAPRKPVPGALAEQGFPHYWGTTRYEYTFDGVWNYVRLEVSGSARVKVNGVDCGCVFGILDSVRIRDACRAGRNRLELAVAGSAAGFLGAENAHSPGLFRAVLVR